MVTKYIEIDLLFYGIGNFCFDNLNGLDLSWSLGYMVELTFSKGIFFQLIPYIQCYDEAKVIPLEARRKEAFITRVNELNEIINNMSRLKKSIGNGWIKRQMDMN